MSRRGAARILAGGGLALRGTVVAEPTEDYGLLRDVDKVRRAASSELDQGRRSELGQFMTPAPIARFMASLFLGQKGEVRLLDAGAGVGSLTAAFVEEMCSRKQRPAAITVRAFEIDPLLLIRLRETLSACRSMCQAHGIAFEADVRSEDFVKAGAGMLVGSLFATAASQRFDCAILNPPYRKISSASAERAMLREAGIETSNLYSAFLALALKLLAQKGELVAITPRSFCNGPYFRPFRQLLTTTAALRRVHVFERRDQAFAEDAVLQENVIIHAVAGSPRGQVRVSSSEGLDKASLTSRRIPYDQVIQPRDPELVIHIAPAEQDERVAQLMAGLPCTLEQLGLSVSTGRVVDFRARDFLRPDPKPGTVPLIYPCHFEAGYVSWPLTGSRKPNAIVDHALTKALLVPSGVHVLVKRFSAKEERKRIVAAVFDPARVPSKSVGFENHLNYFHHSGKGLTMQLARGLATFLNATVVDQFFRQFSGHTQVNATDLRSIRFPSREQLLRLGARVGASSSKQEQVDQLVDAEVFAR